MIKKEVGRELNGMLSKIEKYIFYFFLFYIPYQTREILWYSNWRFNEWQAVSVYATDILLAILLVFWLFNCLKLSNYELRITNYEKSLRSLIQKPDFYLILFIIISAISIKNSTSYTISFYQWIKLIEFSLFYWYLGHYAFKKFGLFNSFSAIYMGGLSQAGIAIVQFFKQSSIGFKYLGESVLNSDLPGVASFYLPNGDKIIRAYGTTPHPNILAGFMLLAIFAFYFIYLYFRLDSGTGPPTDSWEGKSSLDKFYLRDKFMLTSYGVMLFAFFATFSRVIIFIWFLSFCLSAILVRMFRHYRLVFGTVDGRKRIIALLLVSLCAIVIFGSLYSHEIFSRLTITSGDQAVELRTFYAKEAMSINWNLLGVGIGNFVNWLADKNPFLPAYAYQPVHNIYLLIYSETGLIGVSIFVLFLFFLIKDFIIKTRFKKSYHLSTLLLFGSFLFIGFFDHFLWTLQQGRLVFGITLGLLTYLSNNDII